MAQPNPATTIVVLLNAAKDANQLDENGRYMNPVVPEGVEFGGRGGGGFGGGIRRPPPNTLRTALGLHGAGGRDTAEALVAVWNTLDGLTGRATAFPPKKRARVEAICATVKRRLDWEFGNYTLQEGENDWNIDALIADFENLAIDLEVAGEFSPVEEATIAAWETALTELQTSIAESDLPHVTRALFQDVIVSLRTAVRNLRRFGLVACEEDLKDALGRIVNVAATAPESEEKASFLKRAGALFGHMKDAVATVQGGVALVETFYKALKS